MVPIFVSQLGPTLSTTYRNTKQGLLGCKKTYPNTGINYLTYELVNAGFLPSTAVPSAVATCFSLTALATASLGESAVSALDVWEDSWLYEMFLLHCKDIDMCINNISMYNININI